MKKILLIALTVISFVQTNKAQHTINGKVVDALSRQPLENVSIVNAARPGNSTLTDLNGNFNVKGVENNSRLTVSFVGYKPMNIPADQQDALRIALQPDVVSLKDVVILTSTHASKFSTLSKIDLDLKPVRNTQELLRLVPGLFIAQHAGGGKAEQIFLRGFDCDHGTDVQVSVDGLPVNMVSHAHGQGYADSHFIIPETINNIDFGAGPYYATHGNLNTAGYEPAGQRRQYHHGKGIFYC